MKVVIIEPAKQSVLSYLIQHGIKLSAPCGGKGTCGKCKIRVLQGNKPISIEDQNFFSKQQLEQGYRLACRLTAYEGQILEVDIEKDKDFRIVSSYERVVPNGIHKVGEGYSIGIDIGTTTIVLELINLQTGKVESAYTLINSQRQYGADVISRINFSAQGGVEILKQCIQEDILKGIKILKEEKNITSEEIKKIVIAGNTTMLHTLVGINCESLGQYPFTPHLLDLTELKFKDIFSEGEFNTQIILLPGISTYVGADITSGLYFCHMHQTEAIKLFIDIGTNGEMAIGNKDKILALATAAGPAFEGGNISSGIGSIKGAISGVIYKEDHFECQTIGGIEPVGICGSGLIDIMAKCIQYGLIDETGYIVDGTEEIIIYENNENRIVLTQQDIRQVQLAKAAIRAGVEALILEYGVTYNEIETLYLAGGFGKYLTKESMTTLGLIPKELGDKIIKVGNSSLGGCIDYLLNGDANVSLEEVRQKALAINLAESIRFNELFVEHMMFED